MTEKPLKRSTLGETAINVLEAVHLTLVFIVVQ